MILDTVTYAIESLAEEHADRPDAAKFCVEAAISPLVIHSTALEMEESGASNGAYSSYDLRLRWRELKSEAFRQSTGLLRAMTGYMVSRMEISVQDRAPLLRDTRHIGRQFGKLPGHGSLHTARDKRLLPDDAIIYDDLALEMIHKDPSQWFWLNQDRRLAFTEEAKQRMAPSLISTVGCSALATTAMIGTTKVRLYDEYWNLQTDAYIASHPQQFGA